VLLRVPIRTETATTPAPFHNRATRRRSTLLSAFAAADPAFSMQNQESAKKLAMQDRYEEKGIELYDSFVTWFERSHCWILCHWESPLCLGAHD
jgi:hypothetical protein